jgi:tetratricopeptide (TPR) repeat protein
VPQRFGDRDAALAWFDTERANLTAAVTLATTTGHYRHAVDLAAYLGVYLSWRRYLTDWVSTSQHALTAAQHLNNPKRHGIALNNLGLALWAVRRFDEAITAHLQAAEIGRETGDRHSEGQALGNLGLALREVRRFGEAITAHEQELAIFREIGDRHSEGTALNGLGVALWAVRRFDEAITVYQQAAETFRETGDRHSEGQALNNLGLALREVRRFDEA